MPSEAQDEPKTPSAAGSCNMQSAYTILLSSCARQNINNPSLSLFSRIRRCNMGSGVVHDHAFHSLFYDEECPTDPDIAGLGVGSTTLLDNACVVRWLTIIGCPDIRLRGHTHHGSFHYRCLFGRGVASRDIFSARTTEQIY